MCASPAFSDTSGANEFSRELLRRMNETHFHRVPRRRPASGDPEWGWGTGGCRTRRPPAQPLSRRRSEVVFNGETTTSSNGARAQCSATSSAPIPTPKSSSTPGMPVRSQRRALPRHVRVRAVDRKQKRCSGARPLGVKPHVETPEPRQREFITAPELKSLRAQPALRATSTRSGRGIFRLRYVPEPRTNFKRAYKTAARFTSPQTPAKRAHCPGIMYMPYTPVSGKDEPPMTACRTDD